MAEVSLVVFFYHLCDASVRQNVSSMNETIKHFCCLFNKVVLVRVIVQIIIWLQVQNHIESLSVVWNLLIESSEIKFVLNIVFVNFAEELIPSQTTEPRNP